MARESGRQRATVQERNKRELAREHSTHSFSSSKSASRFETMPTVLITGASRGIGQALADLYATNGWNVIATVRSDGAGKKLATKQITVDRLDVTDPTSVASLQPAKEKLISTP